jgi:two-component system, sensor histidine kinase and response regulator
MLELMLESHARAGDLQRCRELGVEAPLTKPAIEAEGRETVVREVAGLARPAPVAMSAGSATGTRQSARPLRILVAEDNPVNQLVARCMLEGHGHTVEVSPDGREAVMAFARTPFDLILMDVQMPEMDGLDATAAIRDLERDGGAGAHIAIVATTAHGMTGDRERCLAAGMDDYVAKPLRKHELMDAIERAWLTSTKPISGSPAPQAPAEARETIARS